MTHPRLAAVTGGTGFIGARTIQQLHQSGWRVRVLTHRRGLAPEIALLPLEVVEGALGDAASLRRLVQGVDAVVHVAGAIRARSRAEFFAINADGVARLVDAVAARPAPPKFVLMSSLAAREPDLSAYAASKRAGEAVLNSIGTNIPWTIFRPPAVYGPGDRATLAFFQLVKRGLGPVLGPKEARLSLLQVDDLARAVAAALDRDAACGLVAELDDGQPGGHTWPALVKVAARHMGRSVRLLRVPRAVLYSYGLINGALSVISGHAPMLTREKVREIYHHDWVCDSRPMLNATAWRPQVSLQTGFPEAIAWYRKHGWL